MWRAVRLLLLCAALGGCSATSGGIASLTKHRGRRLFGYAVKGSRGTRPSSSRSSSSGGIWTNFSSALPAPASSLRKPRKQTAMRYVRDWTPTTRFALLTITGHQRLVYPFFGKPCDGGRGNSRQRHGQPRSHVSRRPEWSGSSETADHVGIPLQGCGGECQRRPKVLCPNCRGVETKPASQPKLAARRCEAYGHRLRV